MYIILDITLNSMIRHIDLCLGKKSILLSIFMYMWGFYLVVLYLFIIYTTHSTCKTHWLKSNTDCVAFHVHNSYQISTLTTFKPQKQNMLFKLFTPMYGINACSIFWRKTVLYHLVDDFTHYVSFHLLRLKSDVYPFLKQNSNS